MSNHIWHAFYFDAFANAGPPARIELIEAENEDEAAEVAKAHLGQCKRVDLSPPRWEMAKVRVIFADERTPPSVSLH